ncbi:MAG: long-chain-fatty-acid--CoA ligase [Desulfuromonadaceae bacterium]|nr:long-chain-fatty-acid--CoA ligase [Desulfuromonadaceae bacterium]
MMTTLVRKWTIGQVLPYAAAAFGDRVALISGDASFSFRYLDVLSNRAANGLAQRGVGRGDRVTLYSSNCWEWIVAYYGILKVGAVVNPINVMLTPEEVVFVANDCGAKAIIASGDKGPALLAIRKQTPIEHIVLFGQDIPAGAVGFDHLLEEGAPTFQAVEVEPDTLSTIGYTSGTTGHPKGAMTSHRNVLTSTAMTAVMHARDDRDTVVSALPCSHVYGNVVMNSSFWYGMTLVLLPKFEERQVLEAIQEHRATMFEGVPTMYMYLLAYPERSKYDVSSLKRCTVGGQTMPVAKMEAFEAEFGCPLLELWGMTEIAGLGTTHAYYGKNRHGSIGVALPGVECRIAAVEDAARTMSAEEVGELMVRGPIVMQGYFGNEQGTRQTIEPDGWLHTGDLARMDKDGFIFVVDRKKDMIITGGFNVYPAELERVIAAHPAVAMVAVGPKPDEMKGEIAKAYIVLKQGHSAGEQEIFDFCRQHLSAYKVPREVLFVEDLPKTSTGKIMRRQLKTLDAA